MIILNKKLRPNSAQQSWLNLNKAKNTEEFMINDIDHIDSKNSNIRQELEENNYNIQRKDKNRNQKQKKLSIKKNKLLGSIDNNYEENNDNFNKNSNSKCIFFY